MPDMHKFKVTIRRTSTDYAYMEIEAPADADADTLKGQALQHLADDSGEVAIHWDTGDVIEDEVAWIDDEDGNEICAIS